MELGEAESRIRALPLLAGLTEGVKSSAAGVFLDVSDLLRYDDGEALIHGGYLSFDTGYVLIDGAVAVESPAGEPIEVKAPALLGEMAQFRAADVRSATVRAKGTAHALQFFWEDLYARADEVMPEKERAAFRAAVEAQVWERFQFKNVTNIGLFADLDGDLKQRVCLPFPSISERHAIKGVDTLFSQGSRSDGSGYLVVSGSIKLFRKDRSEKTVNAPDLVGIFPANTDRGVEWTATAMANGEAEVLKFSWEQYTKELTRRLSREEFQALKASIKNNASKHFWH